MNQKIQNQKVVKCALIFVRFSDNGVQFTPTHIRKCHDLLTLCAWHFMQTQRIRCILLSISYLNVFCVEKCFVWLKFIDTSNIEGSFDTM